MTSWFVSWTFELIVTVLIIVLYQLISRRQQQQAEEGFKVQQHEANVASTTTVNKQNNNNNDNNVYSEWKPDAQQQQQHLSSSCSSARTKEETNDLTATHHRSLLTNEGDTHNNNNNNNHNHNNNGKPLRVGILFATQKGTARSFAHRLFSSFLAQRFDEHTQVQTPELIDLGQYHDLLSSSSTSTLNSQKTFSDLEHLKHHFDVVILYASTYTGGTCPERCQAFDAHLRDLVGDHRVPRDLWRGVHFGVFGLGDLAYHNKQQNANVQEAAAQGKDDGGAYSSSSASSGKTNNLFCAYSRRMAEDVRALGGSLLTPAVYADEARAQTLNVTFSKAVLTFVAKLVTKRNGKRNNNNDEEDTASTTSTSVLRTNNNKKRNPAGSKTRETVAGAEAGVSSSSSCCRTTQAPGNVTEGMGSCACRSGGEAGGGDEQQQEEAYDNGYGSNQSTDEEEDSSDDDDQSKDNNNGDVEDLIGEAKKELLYPRLRQNLEKQNYRLVGSHSAVKLCRWTKSMLRGRGGCYKHTFYNISSFQCMEATPSLACANKCVFCWRHHTNPVARSFSWTHDDAAMLVEGMLREHRQMIKQMRGVPGVVEARLQEAMRVAHCALSLVGEPILYPEMNLFARLLHQHRVSTFLVTNAQFPDQMVTLTEPITQFYLSIDASTKRELQKIDRPVLEDFWERMLRCIFLLRFRQQRTVFRLTLVNEFNMVSLRQYATLVQVGMPDFIEVKGVTYSGASAASNLTIKHSPFHHQVVAFCQELCLAIHQNEGIQKTAAMPYKSYHSVLAAATPSTASAPSAADPDSTLFLDVSRADEVVEWLSKELSPGDDTNDMVAPPPSSNQEEASLDERYRNIENALSYQIACEHEHSCCMLIARSVFRVDIPSVTPLPTNVAPSFGSCSATEEVDNVGNTTTMTPRWYTWIDYDKYFSYTNNNNKLPQGEKEKEEAKKKTESEEGENKKVVHSTAPNAFTALDYACETPSWAVFRSQEKGFDPKESRFRK